MKKLREISDKEGITIDEKALISIARLARGGMRDSQSILDQMISFCGTEIAERDVLDVYGLASRDQIQTLAAALAQADYPEIIALVDHLAEDGRDLLQVLQDLQDYIREALLDAIRQGGVSRNLQTQITSEALMRMLDVLRQGEIGVQKGLSQRVNFEVALPKAPKQSRSRAIDGVIKELAAIADQQPEALQKKNTA